MARIDKARDVIGDCSDTALNNKDMMLAAIALFCGALVDGDLFIRGSNISMGTNKRPLRKRKTSPTLLRTMSFSPKTTGIGSTRMMTSARTDTLPRYTLIIRVRDWQLSMNPSERSWVRGVHAGGMATMPETYTSAVSTSVV